MVCERCWGLGWHPLDFYRAWRRSTKQRNCVPCNGSGFRDFGGEG